MAAFLLAAAVAAGDRVSWPVPSRQLESGGQVELVAVGDGSGRWWTPAGEPVAEPPFRLAPHYMGDEARAEGRATDLEADAEEGQVGRAFVVRARNADPEAVIDLQPKFVDGRKGGGPWSGIVGLTHEVTDPEGRPLPNWRAYAGVYNRGVRPTGVSAVVQQGPWLRELSEPPETVAQKDFDRDVAEGRAADPRTNGTAEYRLGLIEREDGRVRTYFWYRDRQRSQAGRFVIHFADGRTQSSAGGTGVAGETFAMYQTLLPLGRVAAEVERVDIELRAADAAAFEDVAVDPPGGG